MIGTKIAEIFPARDTATERTEPTLIMARFENGVRWSSERMGEHQGH